jgi:hypothetical protein
VLPVVGRGSEVLVPRTRPPYAEISVEVREICGRYGIPYNSGPLHKQFGSVLRKIVKLAVPPLPGRGDTEPDPDEAGAKARPEELAAAPDPSPPPPNPANRFTPDRDDVPAFWYHGA